MTAYVYETIPSKPGEKPRFYEIQQNMKDEPLKKHPETGEPIRLVILGGYGVLTKASGSSAPACGCGSAGCYG